VGPGFGGDKRQSGPAARPGTRRPGHKVCR
jgi:hypothetical protein